MRYKITAFKSKLCGLKAHSAKRHEFGYRLISYSSARLLPQRFLRIAGFR